MQELPEPLKLEELQLSNGLKCQLCRRAELHRICLLLNVASGCRDERHPGTAHMLEHLIFRGSSRHPSLRELSEAFEAVGADFNAYTAREVTSFDVSMPRESLGDVLQLLGEVISKPKLMGIAAERDIIREEIIGDYDGDESLINVDDLLVSLFYGDAGHPIAGDPGDLKGISREDVREFYEAHYASDNMLLVICGPLGKTEELQPALEEAFSEVRKKASPWRRREMPEVYRESLLTGRDVEPRLCIKQYDGATQSEALLGFLCCPAPAPEFGAYEMLVRVLDDGMASRLSRRLVEELALVYDAEAFLSTTQESTLFQIRVTCRHRRVAKVLSAVYELLEEICEKGLEEEEYQRIRRRVIWEHIGMQDGAAQLAQWISTMKLQNMSCNLRDRCSLLLKVSKEDICHAARELLSRRPHIAAIVGDITDRAGSEICDVMERSLKRKVLLSRI